MAERPSRVIRRLGSRIDDQGRIHYDEQPATWADADTLAGRRVDRRRCYAIIANDDGLPELCEVVRWSQPCTGCTDSPEMTTLPERGFGCSECGYTGRVRSAQWVPAETMEAARND